MKNSVKALVVFLLSVFILASCNSSADKPVIENILTELTKPEYDGRMTGTEGNEKAAAFIEREMKLLNLLPLWGTGYIQEFTTPILFPDEETESMTVDFSDGTPRVLRSGTDYSVSFCNYSVVSQELTKRTKKIHKNRLK